MHGGKRKGAGRPAIAPEIKKKSINLKIPTWLNLWLNEQKESKVSLIEKALITQYNLTPPDIKPSNMDEKSKREIKNHIVNLKK